MGQSMPAIRREEEEEEEEEEVRRRVGPILSGIRCFLRTALDLSLVVYVGSHRVSHIHVWVEVRRSDSSIVVL